MTDVPPGAQWPPAPHRPPGRSAAGLDFTRDRIRGGRGPLGRGGPVFGRASAPVAADGRARGLLVALIVVADDHFRRGSVLFAAFVVLAFFLRLFLPDRDAGWLAVRSKGIDLLCLGFLGIGLSVFALIVPPPS